MQNIGISRRTVRRVATDPLTGNPPMTETVPRTRLVLRNQVPAGNDMVVLPPSPYVDSCLFRFLKRNN
jgi:hypothetical protein